MKEVERRQINRLKRQFGPLPEFDSDEWEDKDVQWQTLYDEKESLLRFQSIDPERAENHFFEYYFGNSFYYNSWSVDYLRKEPPDILMRRELNYHQKVRHGSAKLLHGISIDFCFQDEQMGYRFSFDDDQHDLAGFTYSRSLGPKFPDGQLASFWYILTTPPVIVGEIDCANEQEWKELLGEIREYGSSKRRALGKNRVATLADAYYLLDLASLRPADPRIELWADLPRGWLEVSTPSGNVPREKRMPGFEAVFTHPDDRVSFQYQVKVESDHVSFERIKQLEGREEHLQFKAPSDPKTDHLLDIAIGQNWPKLIEEFNIQPNNL